MKHWVVNSTWVAIVTSQNRHVPMKEKQDCYLFNIPASQDSLKWMPTPQCHNFPCKSLFHSLINRLTHQTERHAITGEKDDSQDSNITCPYLVDENRSDCNNKNALERLLPLVKLRKNTMGVFKTILGAELRSFMLYRNRHLETVREESFLI